jgi:hypothetical protein
MTCKINKFCRESTGTMVAGKRKNARIFSKNVGDYGRTGIYIYEEMHQKLSNREKQAMIAFLSVQ